MISSFPTDENAAQRRTPDTRDANWNESVEKHRLRGLLELAPDAMVIVDQAGMIALVNTQTERLFGHRQEEIIGRPVEILVPERFRERHRGHRGKFSAE